ncbi:MAG TPA: lantibiotic dehydratase [Bacilli bacterium]|nr:lantibiotic dehydratase [Bacilli bacterium]
MFQPLDFFMLRSPLLPIERYDELFPSQPREREKWRADTVLRLKEMAADPAVRESVAVSSLSLLHSLPYLDQPQQVRKQEQVLRGLVRYLLRMMTRSTPFGLLSGVSYGSFKERTSLQLGGRDEHKKRTRPDMDWLLKLVRRLESRPEVVRHLRVMANPLVYELGSRVQIAYVTKHGQKADERVRASVRSTPVVRMILESASDWISLQELVGVLQAAYPTTAPEKIERMLMQLFEQEFLISELRPPLLIPSPARRVLEVMRNVPGLDEERERLERVLEKLDAYDRLPIGEGEKMYCEIVEEMRAIEEAAHPVQVDVKVAAREAVLNRDVAEEAARAADVMWRLTPDIKGSVRLKEYRKTFLLRYGYEREVPLLELFDPARGIGVPRHYLEEVTESSAPDKKRDQTLMKQTLRLLNKGETELILTDELVKELEPVEPDVTRAPLSMELYVTLAAESSAAVDAGDYLLHIGANPGSFGAGQTFGRFADMIGDELHEQLKQVHEYEQKLRPEALFAEVVILPSDGRSANVALSLNPRPYEIAMGGPSSKDQTSTLLLSDLVVGLRRDGFYLRSKSLGREVIPTKSHMLNQKASSFEIYRFLCDMMMERTRMWWSWDWGSLESMPFLPRVRYERTVVSPAMWRLDRTLFPTVEQDEADVFARKLQAWREEWKVPRYVFVTTGDHRILLDLEHPLHQEELQREVGLLAADRALVLTESGLEPKRSWVEGEEGSYWNECVIPLVRAEGVGEAVAPSSPAVVSEQDRLKIPGSEWLYAKLYGVMGREEELIGWHLESFCRAMEEEGLAEASFFIRYNDPEEHVRVRFYGEPNTLVSQLLPRLSAWMRERQAEGVVTRLTVDTYDREIERYGGPPLIAPAERLFAADSRVVGTWLGLNRASQLPVSLKTCAVLSVVDLIEQFAATREEQLALLEGFADTKAYQQEFRKLRSELLATDTAPHEKIRAGCAARQEAYLAYAQAVKAVEADGRLHNTYQGIVASIIHMHLNRLLRPSVEMEREAISLVYLTLNAFKHMGR